jgi:hypothetical protein
MKGKLLSSRFLYVTTWKIWEVEALKVRDAIAIAAWEEIFGTPDACARMAIEARISERMSNVAREQAKVWAKAHPDEISAAELALSTEFQEQYGETIEDTAREAMAVMEDDSGTIPPSTKAACASWIRLHPEEMNAARDERNIYNAEQFEEQFPEGTAEVCFKILNGWGNSEEMQWVEVADHWKSFNMEKYDLASDVLLKEMSADFEEKYPTNTYMEAARILEHEAVFHYILDPEVKAEYEVPQKELLNANAWNTLHQGLVRTGRTQLAAESAVALSKQWTELIQLTDNFQKGSVLFSSMQPVVLDEQGQPIDRFQGFRNRLANKFAWAHGYMCLQQNNLLKEITDLAMVDPIEKVLHRVRPSQLEMVRRSREDTFQAERRVIEGKLDALIARIAAWNTYFGWAGEDSAQQLAYEHEYAAEGALPAIEEGSPTLV